MRSKTITERFWSKVEVRGEDECWEWQGYRQPRGYGVVKIEGKVQLSHRIAFLYHYHFLPELSICHSCDNPPCCNPKHLWAGTHDDNMKDMVGKGRLAKRMGVDNPAVKLTPEQVMEVRKLSLQGWKRTELGKVFGVTSEAISAIVLRKTWTHI